MNALKKRKVGGEREEGQSKPKRPKLRSTTAPAITRQLSIQSRVVLISIDAIEEKLAALEDNLVSVAAAIEVGDKQAPAQLAQLHGALDNLLSNDIFHRYERNI